MILRAWSTCIHSRLRFAIPFIIIGCLPIFAASIRTVIDTEYGQYYGFGPAPGDVGIAVLQPHDPYFAGMRSDALKAPHGHFQHFAPADPGDDFPYTQLQAYEASEVAAGRSPIFVTATYAGMKRPVYFEYSLGLDSSNRPTTAQSQWQQAVNLRDDRMVRFYANVYLKKTLWTPGYQNYWAASDNCSFRYNNYGVIDDNGVYQNTIVWDSPFAQSDSDFLDTIQYFFSRLKQLAPDVHVIGNEGSMNDESRFPSVWEGFDGTIREDIDSYFQGDSYSRSEVFKYFTRYQWEGPAEKVAILRSLLPHENDPTFSDLMRTSYLTYLIFRGDNFFYGPRYSDSSSQGLPLADYVQLRNNLGLPNAAAQSSSATQDGYRLYWRTTEGGIVYLNWSGQTQTVTLPSGQYFDRTGKAVTTLTIPDLRGDYALLQSSNRAERPEINPRPAGTVSGPLAVTLGTSSGTGTIRYTLDGSEPSPNSPLYSGPITLASSATIKAKTSCTGCLDSFTSSVAYTVTGAVPAVQFTSGGDNATGALSAYYPVVGLSNPSGGQVSVQYAITGGSAVNGVDFGATDGTLTFQPGILYQSIPIAILNSGAGSDKTIQITLSSPAGASLGGNAVFTYTIGGTGLSQAGHAPVLSNGLPAGTLPAGTTAVTLSVTADEASTCRYATTAGLAYSAMPNGFTTTGGLVQSTPLSGLAGGSYRYNVRCQSGAYTDTSDYTVSFSIAVPPPPAGQHAPVLSNGAPMGILPSATSSVTLSLTTDEPATCRYAKKGGVNYNSMTGRFAVTGGTQHSTTVGTAAGESYAYYVRCSDGVGDVDNSDYVIEFSVSSASGGGSQPVLVRAGGSDYVDSTGRLWKADTNYSFYGGSPQTVDGVIAGTPDAALYFTARVNPNAYEFQVPNGSHTVRLKFAETVATGPGQRVFDVVLNGQFVLSMFDIYQDSGARTADDKVFAVTVSSGTVTLLFYGEAGLAPMISAIEID
jgi:hypothetical protein